MVSWNENEDTVLKLNKKSTIAKQKWNEQKASYVSKISKDIFHPVLFKNEEGTSTLRISLKKNTLEKNATIFVRKTFKIRNGSLSKSQMF